MNVFAAVMTGQGTGAIATIQLLGDAAEAVLRQIFQRKSGGVFEPAEGRVLLGRIVDGGTTIDEVTIGCEGPGNFAIHCHGNPLIVAEIMGLLRRRGAQPVLAEQLLARLMAIHEPGDSIRREAKLALTTVKTIEGATLIANQVTAGLSQKAGQWREHLHSASLAQIAADAQQILANSEPARLVISGCTIALIGPPNTGKSTLLNALAGRDKAIVTDIPGTTRDWVCAEIHIPPLAATVIDTAGLDVTRAAADGDIDQTAQRKSMEILEHADLIVLVLDLSRPAEPSLEAMIEKLTGRRAIAVLNKADLPPRFDPAALPAHLSQAVRISARCGTGIEDLICAIHQVCGLTDFSFANPVAFTERQTRLLERLVHGDSRAAAQSIIMELLEGPLAG